VAKSLFTAFIIRAFSDSTSDVDFYRERLQSRTKVISVIFPTHEIRLGLGLRLYEDLTNLTNLHY